MAFDANGDGRADLYVANYGEPNQLFISQGKKGGFVEQKSGPAVTGSKHSNGAVVLDANGDKWPDLYVVNNGQPNQLLINQKNGSFVEQQGGPAVSGSKASKGAVALNGDGALYVVNYREPNQLLLNDKKRGFVEPKSGPAVTGSKYSQDVVVLHANGDTAPDLYIVNFDQPNQLYLNDKKGGFVEQKIGPAVTGNSYSLGVVAVDVSGDGRSDLYVVNRGQPNQLFINQGKMKPPFFEEQMSGPAVSGSEDSYGAVAFFCNADGAQE